MNEVNSSITHLPLVNSTLTGRLIAITPPLRAGIALIIETPPYVTHSTVCN